MSCHSQVVLIFVLSLWPWFLGHLNARRMRGGCLWVCRELAQLILRWEPVIPVHVDDAQAVAVLANTLFGPDVAISVQVGIPTFHSVWSQTLVANPFQKVNRKTHPSRFDLIFCFQGFQQKINIVDIFGSPIVAKADPEGPTPGPCLKWLPSRDRPIRNICI